MTEANVRSDQHSALYQTLQNDVMDSILDHLSEEISKTDLHSQIDQLIAKYNDEYTKLYI